MRDGRTSSDLYAGVPEANLAPEDWHTSGDMYETSSRRYAKNEDSPASGNAVQRALSSVGGFFTGIVNRFRNNSSQRASSTTSSRDVNGEYLGSGSRDCRICGLPVGKSQARCPHCGAFQTPLYKNPFAIAIAAGLLVLTGILAFAINSCAKGPATGIDASPYVSSDSKDALRSAVEEARSIYDGQASQRSYTIYSLNSLKSALDSALAVNDDSSASDGQVDVAVQGIKDAINSLAPLQATESYEWPSYDDVRGNFDWYLGSSIAMEGSIINVDNSEAGSYAYVAAGGFAEYPIAIAFGSDVVNGAVAPGTHIYFYGTVGGADQYTFDDGTVIDIPVIVCDFVNVA